MSPRLWRYRKGAMMKRKSPMVRIDEVRDHIHAMTSRGVTITAIARASGVNDSTVSSINRSKNNFVGRDIASKILALDGVPDIDTTMCPAIGTARRLRALSTLGHPQRVIAEESGVGLVYIQKLHAHRKDMVSVRVRNAIAQTYERMKNTRGPSQQVRSAAATHGCLPPEAWDGVDIDDPHATPWGVATV